MKNTGYVIKVLTQNSFIKQLIFLLIISFAVSGCSLLSRSDAARAEKKMERQFLDANKSLEKEKKAHFKRQHKETQKMIKQTKRKSKKLNKFKKLNS